jgi:hypothetical protein
MLGVALAKCQQTRGRSSPGVGDGPYTGSDAAGRDSLARRELRTIGQSFAGGSLSDPLNRLGGRRRAHERVAVHGQQASLDRRRGGATARLHLWVKASAFPPPATQRREKNDEVTFRPSALTAFGLEARGFTSCWTPSAGPARPLAAPEVGCGLVPVACGPRQGKCPERSQPLQS